MSDTPLRVVPLGGLGEIGRNMMAIEYGDDIIVIDAGVLFPSEDMPGIDYAIPDITYLVENQERVRAILVTHGHEDHIGALPYVLTALDVPVYSSRLTHGLISVKLKEYGTLKDSRLNVVQPRTPFKIGCFTVEFFRVCHSIPDAMGIAINTPIGTIIHTGDFKIDHTPVDGNLTDFPYLARISAGEVLLLFSDSTYAELPGYTASEKVVGEVFDRVFADARGRVMVATFASLISRMQQVIDAAMKHDRKVVFVGRSIASNAKMAMNMGYLNAPEGVVISMNQAKQLPHEQLVILATGTQGEPTSALVRIANGDHPEIDVNSGDTVVISASPVPGNETLVAKTIDNLYRKGATVLYNRIAMVHVHGHGSQEELKMMLNLVRPRFFVPVHGEYRHLVAHTALAKAVGIPESNIFLLEDGDVLELDREAAEVIDKVPAGPILVDGHRLWEMHSKVLDERRRLAKDGVVVISVTINDKTRDLIGKPNIMSAGFVEIEDSGELYERTAKQAAIVLKKYLSNGVDWDFLQDYVSEELVDFLDAETRRRPTVLVHVDKV